MIRAVFLLSVALAFSPTRAPHSTSSVLSARRLPVWLSPTISVRSERQEQQNPTRLSENTTQFSRRAPALSFRKREVPALAVRPRALLALMVRKLRGARAVVRLALACALELVLSSAALVLAPAHAGAAPLPPPPPATVELRHVSTTALAAESVYGSVHEVPDPRRTRGVADRADMMSASARSRIESIIKEARRDTGTRLVVVTVDGLAPGRSPKEFATELFNHWKLGPADKNNGVLVLVVRDARRIEIEIGAGLNRPLNRGAWLKRMIENEMIPSFKSGRYGDGLVRGVEKLADKLRRVDSELESPDFRQRVWAEGLLYIAGAGMLVPAVLNGMDRCEQCGSRWPHLEYDNWNITRAATTSEPGAKQCICRCKKCGWQGARYATIPMYDGVRYRRDGSPVYYYDSSSDAGSSDGGGSGGSW